MKYWYSFVPDPVRAECVNVGVLAGSEESSEWEIRTIQNPRRARTLDETGMLRRVWTVVDDLGRTLDRYSEDVAGRHFSGVDSPSLRWLLRLADESRNVVQFSVPAIVVAESVEEAIDVLSGQFLVDSQARALRYKKKTAALASLRHAYAAAGVRTLGVVSEGVLVRGPHHGAQFDFVVGRDQAVQLAQTWSFQVPNQADVAEQVKAFSWSVRDLRTGTGLATTESRTLAVPGDVDIEVVYVPPLAGGPMDVLNEALTAFADLDISAVPSDTAEEVGEKAAALLTA
jgi:hypothetical protein